MATKANRTADTVQSALPPDWRHEVHSIAETIEQRLLALFQSRFGNSRTTPSCRYDLIPAEKGLLVGKIGQDAQTELSGNAGRLAKLFLIRYPEGGTLSRAWGYGFSDRAKNFRFHGQKNELKRTMTRLCPGLEYGIERVQGTRQEETRFAQKCSPTAEWNSPVLAADAAHARALRAHRDGDVEAATKLLIDAICLCPLYVPPYGMLRECLKDPDQIDAFSADASLARKAARGIRLATIWHVELRCGFDFETIPRDQHDIVREECLADIDARLAVLRELEDIIRSMDAFARISPANPINAYILHQRLGRAVALTEAEQRVFNDLLNAAAESVKGDERFGSFAKDIAPEDWPRHVEKSLRSALNDVAADKHFVFPEPQIESEGNWRRKTLVLWLRRLFRNTGSRCVPLQHVENVLPGNFDGTTPVSPVSRRKSDHPGRKNDS
jgi:hypothetical protein